MESFKFNKTDYKFILFYFIAATVWLLIRWNIENYTLFEIITGLLGFYVKNLLSLFIFRWLINEYLVVKRNYVVFILLAFVAWELVGFLDMWRDYYTAHHPWKLPSFGLMIVQNFNRGVIDSVMLIGLILGKKYFENKLDTIELQNSQKELELKVLRSQFDPHFLYNSLNTIDALVDYSSKETIKKYISNLAALYRYLIQTKDDEVVALEAELILIKNYFFLIETRFEGDYNFEIVKHTSVKNKYVPNGALLTSIENVVKHNTVDKGVIISSQIHIEEEKIRIVNNKSNTIFKKESLGTGLKNLKKRYELLADKTIEIIESEQEFMIELPILNVID